MRGTKPSPSPSGPTYQSTSTTPGVTGKPWPTQGMGHEQAPEGKASRIESDIDIDVPVRTAYDQWTQFESFPEFLEGVKSVEQLDDKRLHWVVEVGGEVKEWEAEIVDQVPDRLIAWRSVAGDVNHGSVEFQSLGQGSCRVKLLMTYEPVGAKEKVGDALGVVKARVEGDLRRFKKFIEARQTETGAWRGRIEGGNVRLTGEPGHRPRSRQGKQEDTPRTL